MHGNATLKRAPTRPLLWSSIMSWEPEVAEIARRRALADGMGGPDKVQRQHFFGKLTVRERIARMADPDSFRR